jgi:hypothetical protein
MRPDRSMGSHIPQGTGRRNGGPHAPVPRTSLVGGPDAYESYPARTPSYQARPPAAYAPGPEDTLIFGYIGRPRERRPSRWSPSGAAGRLAVALSGVAIVAFAGFVLVPPVLQHLGIGVPARDPGLCVTCLGPIPSSSPLPQAPSAAPSTAKAKAKATAAPPVRRTPAAAAVAMPVTGAPSTTVPTSSGAPPGVTYRATAQADGGFAGQVTVVNHGTAPISDWQLVVALPLDSVSAVQNAAFSYDSDVVFATPAPGDPPISPGGTLVVTIYASGPTTAPADCSFDHVACQ